jgi:hypothetical protein
MADPIQPPASAPAPVVLPDLKSGLKSTEFWLTALSSASALAAQYQGVIPEPWGIVLATGLAAVYTIVRAVLKYQSTQAP